MLTTAWLVLLSAPSGQVPARADRFAFHEALRKVREGATAQEVKKLLGAPEEVRGEIWCFGVDRKGGFPVLGRIRMANGRVGAVRTDTSYSPPAKSVIGDSELFRYLRLIEPVNGEAMEEYDPLFLIRGANLLRPLGKDKALAVMKEHQRILGYDADARMFWLVRVLFKASDPPGFFALPMIGMGLQKPPEVARKWPDYPIVRGREIPFVVGAARASAGLPENFMNYALRDSKHWKLRTAPIRPPDNPFAAAREAERKRALRLNQPESESTGWFLKHLRYLVRNAYRSPEIDGKFGPDITIEEELARFRREFERRGGRWDVKRQMYVRRDGSYTPDK